MFFDRRLFFDAPLAGSLAFRLTTVRSLPLGTVADSDFELPG